MKRFFSLLAMLFGTLTILSAQDGPVGTPYTFMHKNMSMSIDQVDLPEVDNDALLAEDASASKGTPLRAGVGHKVNYTFHNSGRLDELSDGSRLWRLALRSPGAVMMSVVFSHFNIPENATLHIYSSDRSQLVGTYTNDNVESNGLFASDDIIGDELVIEYYEPADALFHGEIEIAKVNHIYRDFLHVSPDNGSKGPHGDSDGDCHIDVKCPEGDGWGDQIKSVVCIKMDMSDGYTYLCSGAMINNVRQDKTPYVLTANHCFVGTDMTGSTIRFYFEYETNECGGLGGNYKKNASGAEVVANANYNGSTATLNRSSDFLLFKITGTISPSFRDNIVFAGWDATGASSVGAGIHHPGGDFKKISIPRVVYSNGTTSKYWVVGWHTNPTKGVTEQGSSGSPLFNANGLIIGDLSTGSSACDNLEGTDNYGKISYSWTNNNNTSNSHKLQPWLDPDNTGTRVLQGIHYNGTPANLKEVEMPVRSMLVSPNPTSGNVVVTGNFEAESGVCNVYNMMGVLVHSENVSLGSSVDMDFSSLPNGIYIMEMVCGKVVYKSKMAIAR